MKNILIVYNTMCIGGSTTSLLSILKNLDYKKYSVDLLLSDNTGDLMHMIPKEVNLLEPAYPKNLKRLKLFSIRSNFMYLFGKIISFKNKNKKNIMGQIMTYENTRFSRELNKTYDVAISFLENFPLNYVSKKVKAKKKITWIHLDYIGAGFISTLDKKCYSNLDKFVLVSEQCLNSFVLKFPEHQKKALVIENILTSNTIKELSNKEINLHVDKKFINLVTVCRITFSHKGLDRILNAFIKLKKEGIHNNLKWYLIGDGADLENVKTIIKNNNLSNNIIILGKKINPFPYEIEMDAFILPSRYEGKPMAITEAQMLGIPPIVTAYKSAKEQIKNRIDGIIVENNDEAIYSILKEIINNPNILYELKENLKKNNYDNIKEMTKIINLIEEKEYE
ncbi:glycosyltransferase [Clostridium perfringens]